MLTIPSALRTKFEEHLRSKKSKQFTWDLQKVAAILFELFPELSFPFGSAIECDPLPDVIPTCLYQPLLDRGDLFPKRISEDFCKPILAKASVSVRTDAHA